MLGLGTIGFHFILKVKAAVTDIHILTAVGSEGHRYELEGHGFHGHFQQNEAIFIKTTMR